MASSDSYLCGEQPLPASACLGTATFQRGKWAALAALVLKGSAVAQWLAESLPVRGTPLRPPPSVAQ